MGTHSRARQIAFPAATAARVKYWEISADNLSKPVGRGAGAAWDRCLAGRVGQASKALGLRKHSFLRKLTRAWRL
jgi:hypothetical protein